MIPSFLRRDFAIPALPPDLHTKMISFPFNEAVFDFKTFKGMFLLFFACPDMNS